MPITIGTYNIAKPGQAGLEDWSVRKNYVLNNLKQAQLDVVCLQEVSGKQEDQAFLIEETKKLGYAYLFEAKKAATGLGIMYKREKFDLVSEKRGEFSSIEEGRLCTRSFLLTDLKDKTTGKVKRVACMHLYGGARHGNTLGERQLKAFREQIEALGDAEIVLAGDMNSDLDEELAGSHSICRSLLEPSSSLFRYRSVTEDAAKNKIVTNRSSHKRHIDWVFVGKKVAGTAQSLVSKIKHYPINQDTRASDHFLHAIEIQEEQEPYTPWSAPVAVKPSVSQEDKAWLESYFSKSPQLHRDTVISALRITKAEAYQRLDAWISAGYIRQEGRGSATLYYRGVNLSGTPVSKASTKLNPRDLVQVKKGLDLLFKGKKEIRRDDIVSMFDMQKSEANGYTKTWRENGLLIQHGMGVSTYYTRATPTSNGINPDALDRAIHAIGELATSVAELLTK